MIFEKLGLNKRMTIAYQLIFWLLFWVLCIIIDVSTIGFWDSVFPELINTFFYALMVYLNVFYLIPNYLHKEKYLSYVAALMTLILLITPIKVVVFYVALYKKPILQSDLLVNKNYYFIVHFLVVALSTLFHIISDWAKNERMKKDLQTQTIQSELKFLKSQINPHFLFNTLNNLYALTLKKSDLAPEIILKLSDMMRYMLYECNEKWVELEKEINYLRNYLDLEKIRQGNKTEVTFEVNGNVDDIMVAPLLYIAFLENSFKHGINHQLENSFVKIYFDVTDSEINFYIENSKPEKVPSTFNKKSGGIGLINVKKRLEMLYENQHTLQIEDTPQTYSVYLQLIIGKTN